MQIVADTNVLLSAYLFRSSMLSWLRDAIEQRAVTIHLDPATSGELKRVLSYPKFKLQQHEQLAVLLSIVQHADIHLQIARSYASLPKCRDDHDQMFLNLAFKVSKLHPEVMLVSGDADLLSLKAKCNFEIVSPAVLRELVKNSD